MSSPMELMGDLIDLLIRIVKLPWDFLLRDILIVRQH
jgi:hypothetical protein